MQPHLWPWLWRALLDGLTILMCLGLGWWMPSWLVWGLCIVVISTRQHALGILGHDAVHGLACQSRAGNAVLTMLCLWPLGLSVSGYEAFHRAHHALVGTPHDPERQLYDNPLMRWQWRWPMTRTRLLLCFVWDVALGWAEWLSMVVGLLRTGGDAEGALLFVTHLLVVSICGSLGAWGLLALWYVPLLTTFWCWFRLRALTEHQEPGVITTHLERPAVWRRQLYLPHNTWCHDTHHEAVSQRAMVPCWALPHRRAQGKQNTQGEVWQKVYSDEA